MQPYFLPYIGYFQLMSVVDQFIVYDNIKYVKKGWINRNRVLANGKVQNISIPLKKASDSSMICERELSRNAGRLLDKQLRMIEESYRKAPFFSQTFDVVERCFKYKESSLFEYLLFSLKKVCRYLNIDTRITVSSTIDIEYSLKKDIKILAICKAIGSTEFINPIGGIDLYSKQEFSEKGVELKFLHPHLNEYPQSSPDFVSGLSIIDVMMYNGPLSVSKMLTDFNMV